MAKFKLAFGIHNHQPVGNFTAVFEEAHRKAYLPFIELLANHPNIRISLHQSGILWDWQKAVHPDYFELIGAMVDRGQMELMTGGFYEPILTAIPQRDALGQIAKLTGYLNSHFGCEPYGLWLAERIWEPHLPKLLAAAGVKYLPVDDTHFIYAGLEHEQLTGPFVTEDEGQSVILLPIRKRLRYLVPFGRTEEVIAELRLQAEENPSGLAVYADDGEKFGVWPKTYEHCYRDRWLEEFFAAVERESDWLEVVPLGEAAASEPVGRAYLPTASYEEMLHWALPPAAFVEYEAFEHWLKDHGKKEQWGRFVRGGHWRGFLAKYEESNLMHKKMLRVSDQLHAVQQKDPSSKTDFSAVREHLYASQCNCPYWHGVFGGLYLPHIRQGVYGHMVQATDALLALSGTVASIEEDDYDCDGHPEVLFESRGLSAVIKPDRGGSLVELCLNRHGFNLTDTLTRRREGYHLKLDQATSPDQSGQASIHDLVLTKEDGLRDFLVEDSYLKRCFIDHFLPSRTDPARFQAARYDELGDFVLKPYAYSVDRDRHEISLHREGTVRCSHGAAPVMVRKSFQFSSEAEDLEVEYLLSTSSPTGVDVEFAVENNLNFQAGHAEDRYVIIDGQRPAESFLDAIGRHDDARTIALVDEYRDLAAAVSSGHSAEIWRMPIFTVSLSEGGFERVYQGTTLVHKFRLTLTATPTRLSFKVHTGPVQEVLRRAFAAVVMRP